MLRFIKVLQIINIFVRLAVMKPFRKFGVYRVYKIQKSMYWGLFELTQCLFNSIQSEVNMERSNYFESYYHIYEICFFGVV